VCPQWVTNTNIHVSKCIYHIEQNKVGTDHLPVLNSTKEERKKEGRTTSCNLD
jgi:hypothetical protein